MILYITQIAFVAYIVLQAYYNYYSIQIMVNASYTDSKYQSLWHTFQALSYVVISLLVAYLATNDLKHFLIIYFLFMLIRQLLFNPILNVLRKKSFFYLSNHGQDLFLKKLFGEDVAGSMIFILCACFIVILNLLFNK